MKYNSNGSSKVSFGEVSPEVMEEIARDREIIYKGVTYIHGSKFKLCIFGKVQEYEIFFSEEKNMFMFYDPITKCNFNFVGYILNLVE